MMGWNDGWGVGGWIAMSLMLLVFWGGLIALVVFLVRGGFRSDQATITTSPQRDADQVLAERFARGEIDEDEFTHRSQVLRTGPKVSS
jgi:putative membrane protein